MWVGPVWTMVHHRQAAEIKGLCLGEAFKQCPSCEESLLLVPLSRHQRQQGSGVAPWMLPSAQDVEEAMLGGVGVGWSSLGSSWFVLLVSWIGSF